MRGWRYDFSESVGIRMEKLLSQATTKEDMRRIQVVYFRARFKDSAQTIADRTGLKLGTIRNIHSQWRHKGEAALELKDKGGRFHFYMTLEEEEKWLKETFGEQAIAGGILEVSAVKRAFETKVGRKVYPSTIYDLLHRHGWRKIAPRPRHPKADIEAQEAFKKSGQRSLSKQNSKLKKQKSP